MGASYSNQTGARNSCNSYHHHRVEVPIRIENKVFGDVTYTLVDGPSTTAASGSSAAQSLLRLKTLRHPNIFAFHKLSESKTEFTRKGSVVGLPVCRHLPTVLSLALPPPQRQETAGRGAAAPSKHSAISSAPPSSWDLYPLTPSEVLYGLRGILGALTMCDRAGIYFTSLSTSQIGIAVQSNKCHALNAHRWVLLDFSTANGTSPADTAKAFLSLVDSIVSCLDEEMLRAAVAQRWGGGRVRVDGNPFAAFFVEEEVAVEETDTDGVSSTAVKSNQGETLELDDVDDSPDVPGCTPSPSTSQESNTKKTVLRRVSTTASFLSNCIVFLDSDTDYVTVSASETVGNGGALKTGAVRDKFLFKVSTIKDPLLAAMAIGHALPSYYAADSVAGSAAAGGGSTSSACGSSNSGVSEALNAAYEKLQSVVKALSEPLVIGEEATRADGQTSDEAQAGNPSNDVTMSASGCRVLPPLELYRCVFPWLLAPEHLAQPVSAHLFTYLFTEHGGRKGGRGRADGFDHSPLAPLIKECLHSSDPFVNMRLFAHSAAVVSNMQTQDLLLWGEGIVYSCFYTSSALAGLWETREQLRYCRAAVKATEHILSELKERGGFSPSPEASHPSDHPSSTIVDEASRKAFAVLHASLTDELCTLLFAAIESAEEMASPDNIADTYRLMRDALLAICAMVPIGMLPTDALEKAERGTVAKQHQLLLAVSVRRCKAAIAMSVFQWSSLTREQAINVVVSSIGTSLPLSECGFLLNTMLTLCGSEESSIRNAACTGLLRLKDVLGGMRDDDEVIRQCQMLGEGGGARSEHHHHHNSQGIAHHGLCDINPISTDFGVYGRQEAHVLPAFLAIESRRLSAHGHPEASSLVAAMGKERGKLTGAGGSSNGADGGIPASPPTHGTNVIFRTGNDKATYVAVLFHSAF